MQRVNIWSIIGAAIVLALSAPVHAQAPVVEGLTVHGHGEIQAKPDIAHASVTISTQQRDQEQAVTENSTLVHTVLAALKGSMIADKDIQTQYFSVQPQYDYRTSPPDLVGYQVTNTMRLTLRDLPKVGLILDKATRAGATSIDGLSFDLSDQNRVQGEALALAIANARSKADLMAGAAGVALVRLISVSDGEVQPPRPMPFMAAAPAAAGEQAAPPTPVQPQLITVTADTTMVYSIEPRR